MLKVTKVKKNSIAYELGIEAGDEILAFDTFACEDELDYLYYSSLSNFSMTVKDHRSGEKSEIRVEKDEDEEMGLVFEKDTALKTCHNRCLFCFVDQMPKGMRESLYVKDDDYGMSFTCGNFVTLTNLSDEGLERIVRLQLSPLYVSVHTLNPELRCKLLRNRFAGKIVEQIDRLVKGGIELHCQAVIVPNMNDGDEFAYTARKLFSYYPAVRELACVPTGLTKYRDGLHEIQDVDKEYSEKFLDLIDALNAEFGVRFIQPADEYFVKAERDFPSMEFYGDFEQIENGVGMTSKFLNEVDQAFEKYTKNKKIMLKKPKKSVWVNGVSASKILGGVAQKATSLVDGLDLRILTVENEFFGKTVTCTGLLTGKDILSAVEKYKTDGGEIDEIILPKDVLKEFDEVFLCGMTLKEFKNRSKIKRVCVNRDGGNGLVEILIRNQ